MLDFIERLDKAVARILEWILISLFFTFFVLVCVLVILRYGFASSIIGGNEFVTIAFVITSALGAALCLSRREHIAITFFIDALPLQIKKAVYLVGLALIAVVNIVMIDYAIDWISMAGHSPWQPFRWPQGIVHAAIPAGCGLIVFFCVLKFILTIGGRESVEVLWVPED